MDEPDRAAAEEFLLKEFETSLDAYWRSEETGERRFDFFLTVTTAVVAAFALREGGLPSSGDVEPVFYIGLLLVLGFGAATLVRVVHRDLKSASQLRAAALVRRYFVQRDAAIARYLIHPTDDERQVRRKPWRELYRIRSGGLADLVMLLNGAVGAGLAALVALDAGAGWPTLAKVATAAAGFVAVWVLQFLFVRRRYAAGAPARWELRFPLVRAAGAVLWRRTERGVEVAVVHRRRHGGDWTFPKGKLEAGESAYDAARREVSEETGLRFRGGTELLPPSRYEVVRDGETRDKEVRYWLAEPEPGGFAPNDEVDELVWLTPAEARGRLSYEGDRRMLERALAELGPS